MNLGLFNSDTDSRSAPDKSFTAAREVPLPRQDDEFLLPMVARSSAVKVVSSNATVFITRSPLRQ